jgi:uncharacterized protein (TIGR03435 family)
MRYLLLSVFLLVQSAPAFDVSSVKPNTSGPEAPVRFEPLPGGRLTTTNTTLRMVAAWAHGVQFFQMVGGPDWVDSARFDISAKVDGNPTTSEMRVMLRELLKDRFKLTLSTGFREMAVYALTVARPGAQLKPSIIDCAGTPAVGTGACEFSYQLGNVHARGMRIATLAETLGGVTGRVVVDRTGLTAPLDFDLSWTPQRVDPSAPSIFTAVEEQLGLKLEATKAPVEVLMIERAERPTAD